MEHGSIFIIIGMIGLEIGVIIGYCFGVICQRKSFLEHLRHFPNFFVHEFLRHFGEKKDKKHYAD